MTQSAIGVFVSLARRCRLLLGVDSKLQFHSSLHCAFIGGKLYVIRIKPSRSGCA